jgi:hypothetical protein
MVRSGGYFDEGRLKKNMVVLVGIHVCMCIISLDLLECPDRGHLVKYV